MLAVLLVSTIWGLRLGLLTTVLSAAAFNYFHLPPTGRFTVADEHNAVALAIFCVAAVVAAAVADLARSRAIEASSAARRPTSRPTSRGSCSAGRAPRRR